MYGHQTEKCCKILCVIHDIPVRNRPKVAFKIVCSDDTPHTSQHSRYGTLWLPSPSNPIVFATVPQVHGRLIVKYKFIVWPAANIKHFIHTPHKILISNFPHQMLVILNVSVCNEKFSYYHIWNAIQGKWPVWCKCICSSGYKFILKWFKMISLIPRLSHRLEYFTFRTISWSWNSSPTISWPVRYASVYIIHMYPMRVAQSATRGTVEIRMTIGCAQLKRNHDLIGV